MKRKKIFNSKGILFWITGISGSGKTSIAKKIFKKILKYYGPTILLSGDDLRKIFNFNGYTLNERRILSKKFCKFAKFITDQNINLIFATVAMMHQPRLWNKKNIKNYVEIYVKSDVKKIIKAKKKKIYMNKKKENMVGIDIKPEYPKKPDIIVYNKFDKSLTNISNNLFDKINELLVR